MGKVLAFRGHEESCANCWYYMIPREPKKKVKKEECHKECQHDCQQESPKEKDLPAHNYCRHPDRVKDGCLSREFIVQQGLHREPGEWCPKYASLDSPVMKMLQSLADMKFALFNIRFAQKDAQDGKTDAPAQEYQELLEQFFLKNKKIMTINQYKAARRDPKYFAAYIDELFGVYKKKSKE